MVLAIIFLTPVFASAEQLPVQRWVAYYYTESHVEAFPSLALDNSGNVYITGRIAEFGMYVYNHYATIKYDPNGNQLWASVYDGPGDGSDEASAIAVDNSGNVYVTGKSYGYGTDYDYATIKYDPNGNQLWVARFDKDGWINKQCAVDLAIDNSGNTYVTGYTGPYEDYATIKYNSDGNEIWVAHYNGPGNSYDYAYAVAVDISGNVYVTGKSYGDGTNYDYATIKYDPNGNQSWAARYNGEGNGIDGAYALAVDNSGNVYVTGESRGSGITSIKYDSNGNQLWAAHCIGDRARDLTLDSSGNVYVTGSGAGSSMTEDYVAIKYDPNGNQLWVIHYNGLGNSTDSASDLAVDTSGNVYITGASRHLDCDYATIKYTQHDFCLGPIDDDLNSDCKVDFVDYAILARDWLSDVDWNDLETLTDSWLECNFALQQDCW